MISLSHIVTMLTVDAITDHARRPDSRRLVPGLQARGAVHDAAVRLLLARHAALAAYAWSGARGPSAPRDGSRR